MSPKPQVRPPRLARWLLRVLVPPEYRYEVLEDTDEEFARRVEDGRFARLWYWRQALHIDVWRLRKETWSGPASDRGGVASMWDLMRMELRQAVRVFTRSPGFVATVVLTLAIGIGGTATIFSLINGLLFRPLPGVENPEQLVALEASEGGGAFGVSSYMDYLDFEARSRSLSMMAAFKPRVVDADAGDATEPIGALMVTSSYFDVLGVRPLLGRFFSEEVDTGPGAHPEVVLTAGLWQRWFAERAEVLGETMIVNGQPYAIIGVAPAGFVGTQLIDVPDVFVPMTMQPALMPASGLLLDRRSWGGIYQVGRLAEGVTIEAAGVEIGALAAQLATEYPDTNRQRDYRALSFRDGAMPGGARTAAVQMGALLSAIIIALWLVVCLNVSNVLLARSLKRRQEMAIRAALGAGRLRIGGGVLLEALAIAAVAGVVGMWIVRTMFQFLSTLPLPVAFNAGLDPATVIITGVLSVFSALVCAFAPSVLLSTTQPREAGAGAVGDVFSKKRWSSRALIVAQVAVSVVLVFGAGFFARSFANLTSADPGFEEANIATAQFNPGLQGYDPAEMVDYFDRLTQAVGAIPGVVEVAKADGLPSTSNFGRDSWFLQQADDPAQSSSLFLSVVSPNYFDMLEIPVVEGRAFRGTDTADQPLVVIINEATARLVTTRTGSPALGQRISPSGPEGPFLEIVGIVGDSRTGRATEASPFVYGAHPQLLPLGLGGQRMVVMLKTSVRPESIAGEFRRVAETVDPRVAASNVVSMETYLDNLLATDRLIVTVLGISSLLAMLLVGVGIYGLLAYVVGRRSREFGIRLALGAEAGSLRFIVMREALALALLGLVLGGAGALALMRIVQDQLFGVSASDPASLLMGTAALIAVTLAAAYLPARRAMRADPMTAIRVE